MADKAIEKSKASSSYKSGGYSRIHVGKLSKKAGFLRRGSPKLHRSSSRETNLSGRHHTGAAKNLRSVDGSWTASAQFSGCGWVWRDSGGNVQLLGTRNFNRRESALHSEVEALRWAMENMPQHSTCQSFGTDSKELIAMIKEPHA
ncbi:hypothetical protein F2Q69_00021500 [Brassica cretica]|uniref:RNase H type-1 domain-containing protein n=1 Tax=Brassica cretica TaxID=69181 RepID=A0A8S9Q972_BRACR|nr:hypothetical protein F2Q69_00021500 [Brassica cretica]